MRSILLKFLSLLVVNLLVMQVIYCQDHGIKENENTLLFKEAKFKTGDNALWQEKDFNDSEWEILKTAKAYEEQGHSDYNGYSWYRIHFNLPASLLKNAAISEVLCFNLQFIDDVDETYLNGELIGKTGNFPGEDIPYESKSKLKRLYKISSHDPLLNWNAQNVLAIKVFDGGHAGGLTKYVPGFYISDMIENVLFSCITKDSLANITVTNKYSFLVKGELNIWMKSNKENINEKLLCENLTLSGDRTITRQVAFSRHSNIVLEIRFKEAESHRELSKTISVPNILPDVSGKKKGENLSPILTWGDQGDGTYRNPVINGDYSDPDVVRVGDDYYMVTSTFHMSPGATILHSKDLVNWEIIGHAFSDISQFDMAYSSENMGNYSHGVWACAIRFHNSRFYVYTTDPSTGGFMTSAINPAGPWEPAHKFLDAKNHDDCCPFWDDDGKAYLTIANFPGGEYDIYLYRMSPDGKSLLDKGTIIHSGEGAEATKLQKINGWYYIFYCENLPDTRRVQMVIRSKNIYGPYEYKRLAQERGTNLNAAQGGLVQTKNGNWYFLHHIDEPSDRIGRTLALSPVTWIDEWPMIGAVESDGVGRMAMGGIKPIQDYPITKPQSSDEFNCKTLGPQWNWNHSPKNDKWSLTERSGFLRLYASKPIKDGGYENASNSLMQRTMGEYGTITTCVDVSGMEDGQLGGICVVNTAIGLLKVTQERGTRFIEAETNDKIFKGTELTYTKIWLRATALKNYYEFSYSTDGNIFAPIGEVMLGPGKGWVWRNWRGIQIGLFNWNMNADKGYLDFDWFHYEYK